MAAKPLVNPHLEGEAPLLPGWPERGAARPRADRDVGRGPAGLGEDLRAAGYTVAGPLLPGHGTRSQDLNHVRWQDWMQTVEESYALLKSRCERVAVGGESTGAVLTLRLAALHPGIRGGALLHATR